MNEVPTAHSPSQPDPPDRPIDPAAIPRITSHDVLRGGREVWIEHQGQIYRLRLTRSGKLILQK